MSEKQYLDLQGLQYYDNEWKAKFDEMTLSNDEIDILMLRAFQKPEYLPNEPEYWTVAGSPTFTLSFSNAYSYTLDWEDNITITFTGNTSESLFWLKIINYNGRYYSIDWDENIEWDNDLYKPTSFTSELRQTTTLFYKENNKWTGIYTIPIYEIPV